MTRCIKNAVLSRLRLSKLSNFDGISP